MTFTCTKKGPGRKHVNGCLNRQKTSLKAAKLRAAGKTKAALKLENRVICGDSHLTKLEV